MIQIVYRFCIVEAENFFRVLFKLWGFDTNGYNYTAPIVRHSCTIPWSSTKQNLSQWKTSKETPYHKITVYGNSIMSATWYKTHCLVILDKYWPLEPTSQNWGSLTKDDANQRHLEKTHFLDFWIKNSRFLRMILTKRKKMQWQEFVSGSSHKWILEFFWSKMWQLFCRILCSFPPACWQLHEIYTMLGMLRGGQTKQKKQWPKIVVDPVRFAQEEQQTRPADSNWCEKAAVRLGRLHTGPTKGFVAAPVQKGCASIQLTKKGFPGPEGTTLGKGDWWVGATASGRTHPSCP